MKKIKQSSTYPTHQDVEDRLIVHQALQTQNTSHQHRFTYDHNIVER